MFPCLLSTPCSLAGDVVLISPLQVVPGGGTGTSISPVDRTATLSAAGGQGHDPLTSVSTVQQAPAPMSNNCMNGLQKKKVVQEALLG